jgi:hypothetical protein
MRKHIHVLPHRDVVPMESHSDGQRAGYFTRTLQTLLLALGYSEPPLFIGTPSLLHENSYLWRVCVIIYERPMTNCICCIYQVVEASTPRWTFERGMREPAREALAVRTNGAFAVLPLPEPSPRSSGSHGGASRRL